MCRCCPVCELSPAERCGNFYKCQECGLEWLPWWRDDGPPAISPWEVAQLDAAASAEDVERARVALADGNDPVNAAAMAKLLGVSVRTVHRWRRQGCDAPNGKIIHLILLFSDRNFVRADPAAAADNLS